MSNELVPFVALASTEEALIEYEGLPNLEKAVLDFIRFFPDRFHYVLSATPDETRAIIRRQVPGLSEAQLQVVHPFVGTVGWVTNEPNVALSSTVLFTDPGSFNQVCCRLRHIDAAYYVWGQFNTGHLDGSIIKAMSPHLFNRSQGDLHLYMGLTDFRVMQRVPYLATLKLIGIQNGNSA